MPPPILDFEPGTEIGSLRILKAAKTDLGQRGQLCECLLCGEQVVRTNSYLNQAGIVQGYNVSCGCSRHSRKPRRIWRDMFLYLILNMPDKLGHVQTDEYDYNSPIWINDNCPSDLQDQILTIRDQLDSEFKKSYAKIMALRMLQTAKFWMNQLC